MAPVTAISFTLAALGLIQSVPKNFSRQHVTSLGVIGSVIATAGLVGMIGFGGRVALAAFHTAAGLMVLGLGMLALAWRVDASAKTTPAWLPLGVSIGMVIATLAFWRALVLGGSPPFAALPLVVIAAGGLIAPVFGATVYLAQRAQAQARALRRSQEFLTEAQHLSRTGSFYWRVAKGEFVWSEQLFRIFELDVTGPVTLERIATRVHPDDIESLNSVVRRALSNGGDFVFDYRLQMPDGSIKYLHMVARSARSVEGQHEYIGAVQDITQHRLSEEALSNARADLARVARITSLGALTAAIAHEVNQPLSGIVTNASTCVRMLDAIPPNIDGARETARRTIRDGNRAAEVIARLRALFVNRAPASESVDLNECAREVIALFRSELQQRRIFVYVVLAEDLPLVRGDRVQLQQVIFNLVRNASDAMSDIHDRQRRLQITTQYEADSVRLDVQDSGTGFEPQVAERLFQPFFTTKQDGMGIGLSVSRTIVESHHGRLWVARNEGPGAKLSLSIPAHQPGPSPS
jgi:signal transduction histidine kinase